MTLSQTDQNPETLIDAEKVDVGNPLSFDVSLPSSVLDGLATEIGALSVRKFRMTGVLRRTGSDALELTADLGATVTQTCVVTLAPLRTRLDFPLRRLFAKDAEPVAADYHISEDEDVDIDPLTSVVDLLQIAREELILALPAYPRTPDAELAARMATPPGATPDDPEQDRPFAALAALKAKMSGE